MPREAEKLFVLSYINWPRFEVMLSLAALPLLGTIDVSRFYGGNHIS